MNTKLNELTKQYQDIISKNDALFVYDSVETLKRDMVHKEGLDIIISHIHVSDGYKVFMSIGKDSKVIFNCIVLESDKPLIEEYNTLFDDISGLNVEKLIKKYYINLKENLKKVEK